ncbi:hypothetical protein ST201phi2-1p292 [Pseudomonas phage 201phi2-1]|uniref:Uncharacterized protein n=1 Tax=Pseudomonas phage 201phi2-1 TaxID=198110 RepID=B3FJF2_BP201|nr:hypothetical protein ST201phi2-1p292 [Pseudomonas phage 201phi2-1]ABY63118.1 hypothetical protein 201phi2-1p292 [Pseudomonas phage 201phi2-1]
MKRIHWVIVGIIAVIILTCRIQGVHAAPMQYFGTPIFYGKYSTDKVECVFNQSAAYGFCGDIRDPEEGVVGLTNPNDPTKGVGAMVRLFTEVVCVKGECASNYGEPLGRIADTRTSYWYIPTGYYLGNKGENALAYRQGTGPMANEFPMSSIKVLGALQDPPRGVVRKYNDDLERYNVYCNESLECSYMGRVMMASQLAEYIPKVLTYSCGTVFCYHADKTIAGLNPRKF